MGTSFLAPGIAAHAALASYLFLFARLAPQEVAFLYRRALIGTAAAIPLLAGFAALLAWLGKTPSPAPYVSALIVISVVMVIAVVLQHGRDRVVPQHSAIEIICLNVAAWFAVHSNPASSYLLIPFPQEYLRGVGYWPLLVLSLWPSWIVLAMVRKGGPHDLRLKLLLSAWVSLSWIVLTGPAAWQAIRGFDASSPVAYIGSLFSSFAAIHALFLAFTLIRTRELTIARHGDSEEEGPASFLASRIALGPARMGTLVGLAIAYYVMLRVVQPALGRSPEMVAIALSVLVIFGNLLRRLTELHPAGDHVEADLAGGEETLERIWERRKAWPVVLVGVLMLAVYLNSEGVQFVADPLFMVFVEIWGFVAMAILLFVAIWIVMIVFDGLRVGGHAWTGARARSVYLMGFTALALWRLASFPWVGGYGHSGAAQRLDDLPSAKFDVATLERGAAFQLDEAVVYLAARRSSLLGRRGRALFAEARGERIPLCADVETRSGQRRFTHFQILDAKRVECTFLETRPGGQPKSVYSVRGTLPRMGSVSVGLTAAVVGPDGQPIPIRAQHREIGADEAGMATACSLESYPAPHVQCGDRAAPLPQASGAPKWPTPVTWHLKPVERRVEIRTKFIRALCLPAEVDGALPFEREAARWPAVVLVRLDTWPDQPLVVATGYDDGASCENVALGNHRLWLKSSELTQRRTFWEAIELKLDRPAVRRPSAACEVVARDDGARVVCGKGSSLLPSTQGRLAAFAVESTREPVEILGPFEPIVCLSLRVDGTPAIAVARLDEPQPATLALFTAYGEDATCNAVDFDTVGRPSYRGQTAWAIEPRYY